MTDEEAMGIVYNIAVRFLRTPLTDEEFLTTPVTDEELDALFKVRDMLKQKAQK